ncbi:protein FAM83D [Kryptolebias marmoratus]|uniref:Family with sequence similarity 83 member E n=1 Tax=Kryptolebias marmoratus TaxID=37003 RepID=A0A3Q3EXR7_KRYMA|nr:protein FAM83D [Kryptolebias marmoratus]XP_037831226.1 protein FAM83D [Kryptolebias marmoratus]
MSNSQEQSLNENAVFLPVDESSPDFLHCEGEREAVERLLSGGPEAYYSSVSSEHAACFLSPEEVSQITSWAQNYHVKELQVEEQNGVENGFETEDFCSTYSPCHSDTPIPNLELGWPEKAPTVKMAEVMVHTSPPVEGEPPVREIIRRYLQNATQVIGIVTDKLTDNAIIGDLHTAASRGVPVYIVLNQRSLQENFTLNKLRHPNMRVRVLRGKTFCSRNGRMVVGEMKVNFLLVDLETVIHGSYSLTWTDAHLHQQLVTVLRGPVVDSFDQQFRILYAASVLAPDTCRVAASGQLYMPSHRPPDFSDFRFLKPFTVEPENTSPPSPPADIVLDWEAMGVVHKDISNSNSLLEINEEIVTEKMPQENDNTDKAIVENITYNGHLFEDEIRIDENTSADSAKLEENSTASNHTESSSSNTSSAERIMRMESKIEKRIAGELCEEKDTHLCETAGTRVDQASEPAFTIAKGRQLLKWETFLEEEHTLDAITEESKPSSRKPVILKVSNSDSFNSLSDIMKRIKQGTTGLLRRGVKPTMSDRAQSMMDLSEYSMSINHKEDRGIPAPRFPGNLDPDHMTPALALMKKRNNEVKSALNRPLKNFTHLERTHSYTSDIHRWKSQLAEEDEQKDERGRRTEMTRLEENRLSLRKNSTGHLQC